MAEAARDVGGTSEWKVPQSVSVVGLFFMAGLVRSHLPCVAVLQVLRRLGDRSLDKRKSGAAEVRSIVEVAIARSQWNVVRRIVEVLAVDFVTSRSVNNRKGGLGGLTSAALALGKAHIHEHLDIFIPTILSCFSDADPRVRFFAVEAMYNVAKTAETDILEYIGLLFLGITRLVCDVDDEVRNAVTAFDDALIELVTTVQEDFDIDAFIPLLRDHLRSASNPLIRMLLVKWITTLDSVPGIDMLDYLPDIVEGLFAMLSGGSNVASVVCSSQWVGVSMGKAA